MSAAEKDVSTIKSGPLLAVNRRSRMVEGHFVETRIVGEVPVWRSKDTNCGIRLGSRWVIVYRKADAKWLGDRGLVFCEACLATRDPVWKTLWTGIIEGRVSESVAAMVRLEAEKTS